MFTVKLYLDSTAGGSNCIMAYSLELTEYEPLCGQVILGKSPSTDTTSSSSLYTVLHHLFESKNKYGTFSLMIV